MADIVETTETPTSVPEETISEILAAGVLYSHKKSKADPRMKPFITANRHEMDMLDAEAVLESVEEAAEAFKKVAAEQGLVLFLGTTIPASTLIREHAERLGQPFVVNRWLGGTLTNFTMIRKRIEYYETLKERQGSGELEKYTKKERKQFEDEIQKLSQHFEGLSKLDRLPNALFVVDPEAHEAAIREAHQLNIPIFAVLDTNDNPQEVAYPIIANDHTKSSIAWALHAVLPN